MKKSYKKGPRFGPDIHRPIVLVSQPELTLAPTTKQEKKEEVVVIETPKIIEEKSATIPVVETIEDKSTIESTTNSSINEVLESVVVEEKKIEHQKLNDVRRKK
jgi:hypothetical protein